MYFLTTLVSFCSVNCGESLGIILNTLFADNAGFAFSLGTLLILVAVEKAGENPPYLVPQNLASEMRVSRDPVRRYACILQGSKLFVSAQIRHRFAVDQSIHGL